MIGIMTLLIASLVIMFLLVLFMAIQISLFVRRAFILGSLV